MAESELGFTEAHGKLKHGYEHLALFAKWFSQAKDDGVRLLNDWGRAAEKTVDLVKYSVRGVPIHFVALNTAALSHANSEREKLAVSLPELNASLAKVTASEEIVVAVAHHPLDWLSPWNAAEVGKLLRQETGAHLLLHGHLHESLNASAYDGTGAGMYTSKAGAAYPGSKWQKSFSLLRLLTAKKIVRPSVFTYSDNSGKWHKQSELSREIPLRLPAKLRKMKTFTGEVDPPAKVKFGTGPASVAHWDNPFSAYVANGLPSAAVHRLFVDKRHIVSRIAQVGDAIVEGQRGTGKTMLLRYFSAEVQASVATTKSLSSFVQMLNKKNQPFGLFCLLSSLGFLRSELAIVTDGRRRSQLFGHRIACILFGRMFEVLAELVDDTQDAALCQAITKAASQLVAQSGTNIEKQKANPKGSLLELLDHCNFMVEEVDAHVRSLWPGGAPTPFNPKLSLSTFLLFAKSLKRILCLEQPIFLLLDDFDVLDAEQQTEMFGWAAGRVHDVICFKFGIITHGQKSNLSGPGRTYRPGDDYVLVQLNWVDGGLRGREGDEKGVAYLDVVRDICKLRLENAGWPATLNFENLFAEWEQGTKIKEQVRALQRELHQKLPLKEKAREQFASIWTKRGEALYFRHLRAKGIQHRYAGATTIVDLSSGILRQFLEICNAIVAVALASGWTPSTLTRIGPSFQNAAIRDWSDQWLAKLTEGLTTTELQTQEQRVSAKHLVTLANSLSRFFSERLYSESKDPELIAIAIRGAVPAGSLCESILRIAVRESILQPRSSDYTSKSDTGVRLPTYLLNRRLVPRVNIGTKLQGRYEISTADVELASLDTERFLKKMGLPKTQGNLSWDE
jgi:Cdc6-like AAA superfamily ATPase